MKKPKNQNRIPVNATYYMVIKIDENKFIVILVSFFSFLQLSNLISNQIKSRY